MQFDPLNNLDHELFVYSAFRYALGRMTYIVSSICDVLIFLEPELSNSTKEKIIKEIDDAIINSHAGMKMDVEQWTRVKNAFQESMNPMDLDECFYICSDCAKKNGGQWPKGHVATMHSGICDCCKQEKTLSNTGDWNWSDGKSRGIRD